MFWRCSYRSDTNYFTGGEITMGICILPQEIVVPSVIPEPGKSLNEYTWEEIDYISSNGLAGEYGFQVGDAKAITLNGTVGSLALDNYQTYAYIIGINHNAALEGNNLIHFQLAKTAISGGTDICFTDGSYNSSGSSAAFRMNTSNTSSGGWKDLYMRNNICGTDKGDTSGNVMGIIPSDLLDVLKPVTKYTNNVGESDAESAVTATTDYFFLLAEYEVFGNITYSNSYEANYQQQYAYYSAGNSKVKYRHNSTGSAARWWLRSPSAGYSSRFVRVIYDGSVSSNVASFSYGFAPGFCV